MLSKCNTIISHRSSVFEGRHNNHQSSKVDTSIVDLRRWKHRTDNPTSHRHSDNSSPNIQYYCPQQCSIVMPKIPCGTHNIRRRYTCLYTYIRQQPHTCTSHVLYTYLYCVYALVRGTISIRDPYICAVLRVCANGSHAVFHRPVV